jgi:hypothetical protein
MSGAAYADWRLKARFKRINGYTSNVVTPATFTLGDQKQGSPKEERESLCFASEPIVTKNPVLMHVRQVEAEVSAVRFLGSAFTVGDYIDWPARRQRACNESLPSGMRAGFQPVAFRPA